MKKIFLFLLIPCYSFSQSYDVLFIGNSYTYYNDLPQMLSDIASAFGDSISYDQNTPGGSSLYAHSQNQITINKINQQSWDYVVLQGQSQNPSLSLNYVSSNVYPYANQLVDFIELNDICTEPVFYMTWGRKYGDQSNCSNYPPVCTYLGMQQRLRESYLSMGIDNSASVSPVGIAFKNSIALDSTIDLYSPDYSHPSIYGSYLAACTFYSTIFRKSAVACSYKPNSITSTEALFLQQVASSTVLDSLSTWNIFQASFDYDIINDSVNFINKSSNYENCVWDFGDGNQSLDINPKHTYLLSGIYDISLTCYNNSSCLVDFLTLQININIASVENQNPFKKKVIKSFDIMGREVDLNHKGLVYQINNQGEVIKCIYIY
jgi:hypothetical protein